MRKNADSLYCIRGLEKEEVIKFNFLFYTAKKSEWKYAICEQYKNIVKEKINNHGERLIICNDEMLDTKHSTLTISIYNTGICLVQGNDLESFEEKFSQMKTVATNMNNPQDPVESPEPQPLTSDQPKDEKAKENDTAKTVAEKTSSSVNELADDFSAMPVK